MITAQHVYDDRGELRVRNVAACGHDDPLPPPRKATIATCVPITAVMSRTVICARPDLSVPALAQLFLDEHIGCIPIIDERGRPQGIVTKSDVVGQLSDALWPLRTAREVMMPLALTLDERATLAHAASLMTLEDLHHVMVVSCSGALIGIVSAKDVVRWLVQNDQLTGYETSCRH
jgi:CBS-domain-containing membrane protein